MATKERTADVFPLAAPLRFWPETRVWGPDPQKQTFVGGLGWLSSTTRWGCGYSCDGTTPGSSVGRFNSPDPYWANDGIKEPGSWNRYAYVGGDPINYNDRSGNNRAFVDGNTNPCGDPAYFYYQMTRGDTSMDGCGSDGSGDFSMEVVAESAPPPPPRRKLDPKSDECVALARKITNIALDIAQREIEIQLNPLNLPQSAPGPPRDSVDGHRSIVEDLKKVLAQRTREYIDKCDGPPPSAPPVIPIFRPNPAPAGPGIFRNGVVIGVGVAIACALFPELCMVVIPVVVP